MNYLKQGISTVVLMIPLLLWQPQTAQAQDIFYSKEQDFNFQNGDFSVIGHTGQYLFTYTASQKGYFLNAFNDSMALKAKIALDFFPENIMGAKFINYDNHIIVLYQAQERNYIIQYAALLNQRALLSGRPVALDSVRSSWFGNNHRFFSAAVSSDKSKIMIYGMGRRKLRTTLINDQLQVLQHVERKMDIDGRPDIQQAVLDNQGWFYFLCAQKVGNKNYATGIQLYQLTPKNNHLSFKSLNKDGYYYSGIHLKINQNNNAVYVAGFYSERKNGNIEGIVFAKYQPEKAAFSIAKNIPFNNQLKKDTGTRNKNKAFNDAEVKELIIKNSGGFLLIAENTYVSTRSEMTPGWGYYSWYYSPMYANQTIYEYHYGDIALLSYDDKGNLIWDKFIRKNQYSQDDNGLFSSYAFLNAGSSLVFLFNNYNNRNSTIELAAVNASGKLQMQALNTGDIGNADWIPKRGKQISKTSWLVPILNRNHLFFARISF